MVMDFATESSFNKTLQIGSGEVENGQEYEYLCSTIGSFIKFETNVVNVYKKVNQRMYFVRKLNHLRNGKKIIYLFH